MSINQSSPVCRRLFQSNDDNDGDPINVNPTTATDNNTVVVDLIKEQGSDQNFANTFIEHLQRQREEMQRKYNFDFVNEIPLEGNYVWERVVPDLPAPENQPPETMESEMTEQQHLQPQMGASTPQKSSGRTEPNGND